MKALTLHQPYASAIALGLKRFETRSWRTSYRGPLAIHAGAKLLSEQPMEIELLAARHGLLNVTYRAIVAVCFLDGCFETPSMIGGWREHYGGMRIPWDETDRAFGDFAPGRYAWRLDDVRPLPEPIPMSGHQGLWTVPDDVAERLIEVTHA